MKLMAIKKELKDLKLGKKSAADLEYLQSLTADFFADRQHEELLDDWNHLQKTPGKTRIFTFATKRCPELIVRHLVETYPTNKHLDDKTGEYVWDNRPQAPFYAYIKHDNDTPGKVDLKDPESGIHYHFYLEYANARSFASVATELGIPVTMLQSIKVSKKAVLQYLTHENDPSKHHYSASDVHANFDIVRERDKGDWDVLEVAQDVWDLRHGKISYSDFIVKYHSILCDIKNFTTLVRTCNDLCLASDCTLYERGSIMK